MVEGNPDYGSPGNFLLYLVIVDGLAHLRLERGQESGAGPHHFFTGDQRLQPAHPQVGVGLPGQGQGCLQIQGGRSRGRSWDLRPDAR